MSFSAGSSNATSLQGTPISAAKPSSGQYLTLVSGVWSATSLSSALSGDVTGNWGASVVSDIGGVPVAQVIPPSGTIIMYAAAAAPTGWLACDGSNVNRTTYATLFGIIGTTWGSGNGTTTFGLPNLQCHMPIGSGTYTGFTARTLADNGGSETTTLATANLPSHNHGVTDPGHTHGDNIPYSNSAPAGAGQAVLNGAGPLNFNPTSQSSSTGITINNTGSGTAATTIGPYVAVLFMIKT